MAGFKFGRSAGMEGSTGNLRDFRIDPTNTDAIFTGDPVTLNAGNIEAFSAGAVTDADILGFFSGCRKTLPDGSLRFANYWDGAAGQSDISAQVSVAGVGSTVIAELGVDGSVPFTQAMVGRRVGFTQAAGNAATGESGSYVTSGAAVATGPLVIHGLADIPQYQGSKVFVELGVARPALGMAEVA